MSFPPSEASRKKTSAQSRPLVIIPARLGSARLPGKPLAIIAAEPMIVHVWRRAREAAAYLDGMEVLVATDAPEIRAAVEAAGGAALLTDGLHFSGTDRIFEALQRFDPRSCHDIVINLQGDMPDFPPGGLALALEALARDEECAVATLAGRLQNAREAADPNVVKAVVADWRDGFARAVDFTRAPAPPADWRNFCHHVGVYAWRRESLARFVSLPPSPREIKEGLEQLRAMENGMDIHVGLLETMPVSVDTPMDLQAARARFLAQNR